MAKSCFYAFGAAGAAAGVIAPGPPGMPAGFRRHFRRRPHAVAFEVTRKAELAQLVPHHVLGHIHRDNFLPLCTAMV